MSTKIFVALLAIFGMIGMSFAWGGFMNSPVAELPDEVKEEFKAAHEARDFETLKELREEYLPERPSPLDELDEETKQEILSLKEQIHDAMISGDYETAKDLRAEMKELLPEDFRPMKGMRGPHGMRGFGGKGMGECSCAQGASE
jgi:hypothetical protein